MIFLFLHSKKYFPAVFVIFICLMFNFDEIVSEFRRSSRGFSRTCRIFCSGILEIWESKFPEIGFGIAPNLKCEPSGHPSLSAKQIIIVCGAKRMAGKVKRPASEAAHEEQTAEVARVGPTVVLFPSKLHNRLLCLLSRRKYWQNRKFSCVFMFWVQNILG